jgi:hypothetical protein
MSFYCLITTHAASFDELGVLPVFSISYTLCHFIAYNYDTRNFVWRARRDTRVLDKFTPAGNYSQWWKSIAYRLAKGLYMVEIRLVMWIQPQFGTWLLFHESDLDLWLYPRPDILRNLTEYIHSSVIPDHATDADSMWSGLIEDMLKPNYIHRSATRFHIDPDMDEIVSSQLCLHDATHLESNSSRIDVTLKQYLHWCEAAGLEYIEDRRVAACGMFVLYHSATFG